LDHVVEGGGNIVRNFPMPHIWKGLRINAKNSFAVMGCFQKPPDSAGNGV